LTNQWRKQRGEGKLFEKKRGPTPKEKNPLAAKVAALVELPKTFRV